MSPQKFLLSIAFLLFSTSLIAAQTAAEADYPPAPAPILDAEIALTGGGVVRPRDFAGRTLLVFLVEAWSAPAVKQAEFLRERKKAGALEEVEILGVSFETDAADKKAFRKFARRFNYRLGWSEPQLRKAIVGVTKLDGNPEILVLHDGKIRGVFLGASQKVNEALEKLLTQIASGRTP